MQWAFVDDAMLLSSLPSSASSSRSDGIDERHVELELRAQVAAFAAAFDGRLPHHVDGHNHCHVLSDVVACVVARTLHALGIARVRLPCELACEPIASWLDAPSSAALRTGDVDAERWRRTVDFNAFVARRALAVRAIFDAAQLDYATHFVGLHLLLASDARQPDAADRHGALLCAQLSTLLPLINAADDQDVVVDTTPSKTRRRKASVELMCHPGFAEPALASIDTFSSSADREVELRSLCLPSTRAFVAQHFFRSDDENESKRFHS